MLRPHHHRRPRLLVLTALCSALAVACFTHDSAAQSRNTVTWQPVSLAHGSIDLEYERAVHRYVSVFAAPGFIFALGYEGPRLYSFTADVGVRVFPMGEAPSGVFLQTHIGMRTTSENFGLRVPGLGVHAGLMIGWSLILWRHVDLSIGLGAQYLHWVRARDQRPHNVMDLITRLAVGVAF